MKPVQHGHAPAADDEAQHGAGILRLCRDVRRPAEESTRRAVRAAALSSAIRRAKGRKARPYALSVTERVERSNSGTPNSDSSFFRCFDREDWDMCSSAAEACRLYGLLSEEEKAQIRYPVTPE